MTYRNRKAVIIRVTANQRTRSPIVPGNAEMGNGIPGAKSKTVDFHLGKTIPALGTLQATNHVRLRFDNVDLAGGSYQLRCGETEETDVAAQVNHGITFLDERCSNPVDFWIEIPEKPGCATNVVGTRSTEGLSTAKDSVDFVREFPVDPSRHRRQIGNAATAGEEGVGTCQTINHFHGVL